MNSKDGVSRLTVRPSQFGVARVRSNISASRLCSYMYATSQNANASSRRCAGPMKNSKGACKPARQLSLEQMRFFEMRLRNATGRRKHGGGSKRRSKQHVKWKPWDGWREE